MVNNSSTGGYLVPSAAPAPLEDAALLDFFHDWIAGLTGVAAELIRPRWQPEPANIPEDGVTWLAFGITKRQADTFAADLHYPITQGYNELRRHEILSFMVSCYGPNADAVVQQLSDGMQVAQNREVLQQNNMGLVECNEITALPELVKDKWLYRVDMPFKIKRQIVRQYPVENILVAQGVLHNEHYDTPLIVP